MPALRSIIFLLLIFAFLSPILSQTVKLSSIESQKASQTQSKDRAQDDVEPIMGTNLDTVNSWWPPQATAAEIGVPTYAEQNKYNLFSLGTWTCKNGAFDIAKLWSDASFYLSKKFGNTTSEIQAFLKKKYQSEGKKIVVRAFSNGQSPTSARLKPELCARALASFVLTHCLDGVDVQYKDNQAFNAGTAQSWLITFSKTLRTSLPSHLIYHSIQSYHLNKAIYKGGSYQKVIRQVGDQLDFYSIVYYGDFSTPFNTYEQLFVDSGSEIPQSAVIQLQKRGFQLNKIVISKPVILQDAEGAGYVQPVQLREIFLRANRQLGWKGGIIYSSYLEDRDGCTLLSLVRGMSHSQSIRFTYINNVKTWWPPSKTIAQMGAPLPNTTYSILYNYFAYAFWTFKEPKAISKMYNDPVAYLGTELGEDKTQIQQYMKKCYADKNAKLMVSTFGDTQFPTSEGIDPIECADKLVEYVRGNLLDGVDIDYEDSQAFINGTGVNWLNLFMSRLRSQLPYHIISHAPQAPYFSSQFDQAYLQVNKKVGKLIDFYNIQYYNQGNTSYTTYDELFIDSGPLNPLTAVFELIAQGVPAEKIVVGKPVTPKDAYNSGHLQPEVFNKLLKKSQTDKRNPGWRANVMFWHFLSDLDGKVIQSAFQGL